VGGLYHQVVYINNQLLAVGPTSLHNGN